jgi:2-polyprenyl-3-methyl-5-hydroxy-6-metoxy-1,4-benzoquinol methylase
VSAATHSADGIVTGNTFDKYGSRNPVVRRLMANFEHHLADLLASTDPQSVLDIGCGEGVLTHRWATELAPRRVVGVDLDDPLIAAEWAKRSAPNLEFVAHRAEALPFADDEFDVATAIEVLEHVPDPAHTVAEMARCASGHLLVSVPHEPLWRALNMARGAYWREWGNTPGHVNHFSKAAITALCARYGDVIETRSPFPWTMVLVRV